jgi:hypothetical protein
VRRYPEIQDLVESVRTPKGAGDALTTGHNPSYSHDRVYQRASLRGPFIGSRLMLWTILAIVIAGLRAAGIAMLLRSCRVTAYRKWIISRRWAVWVCSAIRFTTVLLV